MATQPPLDDEWEDITDQVASGQVKLPAQAGAADEWEDVTDQQAPEQQSGPEMRFLKGVGRTLLPSWDTVKEVVGAHLPSRPTKASEIITELPIIKQAKLWSKFLQGAAEQQFGEAEKASRTEGLESALHGLAAAVPFVGPPAAAAAEKIGGGEDIAGGVGEAAGLLIPTALPFRSLRTLAQRPLARALEAGAKKNVLRALKPEAAVAPSVLRGARDISDIMGVGTSKQLLEKIAGPGAAEAASSEVGGALEKALDKLKQLKEIEGRLSPQKFKDVAKSLREQLGTVTPETTPGAKPAAALTLDPAAQAATEKIASRIEGIAEQFPEGIPTKAGFKFRSQLGKVAERGGAYKKKAGQPRPAAPDVAMKAQADMTQILKSEVPGLADADLTFSTIKKAQVALKNRVIADMLGNAPAAEVVGGKYLLGSLIGGGAIAGGAVGAGAGALGYGAYKVISEMVNSPLWNSLSAKGKFALIDTLGTLPKGTASRGAAMAAALDRARIAATSEGVGTDEE